jgi:AmmeMemoRadiSam system protein B
MATTVREPAVAGTFYPGAADELDRQVHQLAPVADQRHQLLGCVVPHAGYVYSGSIAGAVFGHLDVPRRVIVIGPNHTGVGAAVAVAPHEAWRTPAGNQPIDDDLTQRLADTMPGAQVDSDAHWREHSLEVQLPFLRARQPDVEFAALCLGHLSLDHCLAAGSALAEMIVDLAQPVGLVASSDMSHYVSDDDARRLDHMAITAALERDPAALYETVHRHGITMCGVVPATVVLEAANQLGATGAHLVAYATSGDVSGDRSAVVGYAGICIHA